MFNWARERISVLTLQRRDPGGDRLSVQPELSIAAVAQHVRKRVVAISSAGDAAAGPANLPAFTPGRSRRPGVHARWKEQNRLPSRRFS